MTKLFKDKDEEAQANSLAQFLPLGTVFDSKNETTSVLRKFLEGLSGELKRVYDGMNDLSADYDINNTIELLTRWESAVGIPDDCFLGIGTIEERRTHVLMKLAKMNVQTAQEFVTLGIALGFTDVQVFPLQDVSLPPYSVPFIPSSLPPSRFTILVTGSDIVTDLPPYDVPFTPASENSSILQCVFEKVRPANVQTIFVNTNEPAPFSPINLGNLALWLDASDESTITESAGAVSQWDDKSGNAYHATQGTGANQLGTKITTLNGLNVLDADGSDFMNLPSGLYPVTNNDMTIFAVAKQNATATERIISAGISGSTRMLLQYASGDINFYNNSAFDAVTIAIDETNFNIITSYREGSTQSIAVNAGTPVTDSAGSDVPGINQFKIASNPNGSGEFLTGNIAEIIIYSTRLSDFQINQVNEYLSEKWAITI